MDITIVLYIGLLVTVGLVRLVELGVSTRNQRTLARRGVARIPEPHFRWMVLFHIGILVASGLEVVLLHRPLISTLAIPMAVLFVLANGLRWWVIRSMAEHWNVQVMASVGLGVVSSGPYRWVRHPNYDAVFVELIALPLIHTAWITATVGACIHVLLLRRRLAVEEATLLANADYMAVMACKPRFIPWPLSKPTFLTDSRS